MRTTVNHTPPTNMQRQPHDNVSACVMAQVEAWSNPRLIHTQSAMEIAAWFVLPGNTFYAFSSTGTIHEDLIPDIQNEIADLEAAQRRENGEMITALKALLAYVNAVKVER